MTSEIGHQPPERQRSQSSWSRCEEAVARIAPTSTTTCQVCSTPINSGDWQLGLMYFHIEGFMLMEWHHLKCIYSIPNAKEYDLETVITTAQNNMESTLRKQFQAALQAIELTVLS